MEIEIWKLIDWINPTYEISSFGRCRRLGSVKYLRAINRKGYLFYTIYTPQQNPKIVAVHRLVAIAFLDNPHNKNQVNHIDCSKDNNYLSNLEWSTGSENIKHAYKNGLIKSRSGINSHLSNLTGRNNTRARYVVNLENGIYFDTVKDAANAFSLNPNTLSGYLSGFRDNKTSLRYAD